MGAFTYSLIFTCVLVLLCLYFSHDSVHCRVEEESSASSLSVSGYYVALSGSYRRLSLSSRSRSLSHSHSLSQSLSFSLAFPDVIELLTEKTRASNLLSDQRVWMWGGVWVMSRGMLGEAEVQCNSEKEQITLSVPDSVDGGVSATLPYSLSIHHPPRYGWHTPGSSSSTTVTNSAIEVIECVGELNNAPEEVDYFPAPTSGFGTMVAHPVTTSILCFLCYYAYYLWSNTVEVSSVSFSYDAVINKGEYWRIVSASVAHFDLWHLGFNTMALYNLGDLEPVYGSVTYAYLSLSLIVLTMLIVVGIHFIMIHRYHREEYATSQAVGYSAVLFAWMVAISVRQSEYCPIFIFPSFCIKTYWIPIPGALRHLWGIEGLPVNLGPFVLLVVTKFIIPRSSFIGHLAGILIGYPLAWNALNWLTPPISLSLIIVAWIISTGKFVWRYPSFELPFVNLRDFISPSLLSHTYTMLWISYPLMVGVIVLPVYFLGWGQLFTRLLAVFLVWSATEARRIECYSDNPIVQSNCSQIIIYSAAFVAFLTVYDVANVITVIANQGFLLGNGYVSPQINLFVLLMFLLTLMEGCYVGAMIIVMNDIPKCAEFLAKVGLERRVLRSELVALHLINEDNMTAFTGQFNRLETNET